MPTHAQFSKLLPFIACLISTGTGTRTKSGCEARKVDCKPTVCPAAQGSHFFFRPPPLGRLLRQRSLHIHGRPGKLRSASSPPRAKTSMTRWESRKLTETCPSSENERSAVGDGRSSLSAACSWWRFRMTQLTKGLRTARVHGNRAWQTRWSMLMNHRTHRHCPFECIAHVRWAIIDGLGSSATCCW